MTTHFDIDRFQLEYRRAIADVLGFLTPERQVAIARHNPGLEPSKTDLSIYLKASEKRYAHAVRLFERFRSERGLHERALDVGGFLGAYPLTLARLGVQVALAEVFAYYGGALDELSSFLASQGVEILDVDFTQPLSTAVAGKYTMVTNMAMLEHLSGSPQQLMSNLRAVTDAAGAVLVEVPNIAYWPNRLNLLRGRTVHPPLEVVFRSASPFTGHHREYTVGELQELLRWTGFHPVAVERFNYSIPLLEGRRIDRAYALTVQLVPTLVFRNCRELIMVLAVPADAEHD